MGTCLPIVVSQNSIGEVLMDGSRRSRRASLMREVGAMFKPRRRSSAEAKKAKRLSVRASVRYVGGHTWFTKLPKWIRLVFFIVFCLLITAIAIGAMPVLAYFSMSSASTPSEREPGVRGILAEIGLVAVLSVCACSSGASLLAAALTSELCFAASRYVGRTCLAYAKSPVNFVLFLMLFWVIFWICLSLAVSGIRNFGGGDHDGAS